MRLQIQLGSTVLSAGALLALAASAPAQVGGGFVADPQSLDTLSGGPVGGGSNFNAINRAQSAANQANASPFGQPPGGDPFAANVPPGGDPFAQPGGDPFAQPPGGDPFAQPFGGDPFANDPFANDPFAQPGAGQPGIPQPPATLTAWGGERIICHRTGEILQDAREISILATMQGNYYDDGENGNDAVADDNIYTNITVNTGFLSPEAHVVKTKLIETLRYVSPPSDDLSTIGINQALTQDLQSVGIQRDPELRRFILRPRQSIEMTYFNNLTPMQFSGVRVATTEPTSPLPKLNDLEREQDEKLRAWGDRFLRDFRMNPDDFTSEFYPTFLPPPPRAPNIPLPVNFTPNPLPEDGEGQFGGGGRGGVGAEGYYGFANDPVTGEPIGNASSRYF